MADATVCMEAVSQSRAYMLIDDIIATGLRENNNDEA